MLTSQKLIKSFKILWNYKGLRLAKRIKKNKVVEFILFHSKTYYDCVVHQDSLIL